MELGLCAKAFDKICKRNEYISSINDAYYIGVQIHSLDDLPYSIKRFRKKRASLHTIKTCIGKIKSIVTNLKEN